MSGKGSTRRPPAVDDKTVAENWEGIDWNARAKQQMFSEIARSDAFTIDTLLADFGCACNGNGDCFICDETD